MNSFETSEGRRLHKMKSIGALKWRSLSWMQPKAIQRYFELRHDKEVYATLTWQKTFGSLAVGTYAGESISLKRAGFLSPYISVRVVPTGQEIALLRMRFGGYGEFEFADGRKYTLQKLGFWKREWGLADWNNVLMLKIIEWGGLLKNHGDIRLQPHVNGSTANLARLLVIAWYAITLIREEQAAAASSAAIH